MLNLKITDLIKSSSKKTKKFCIVGTLTATALSFNSCGTKTEKPTIVESIQSVNEFDLLESYDFGDYKIIETTNVKGDTGVHFAQALSLSKLYDLGDEENYDRYFDSSRAYSSDTYFYFDSLNGDLLSVKYVKSEKHLFKDSKYEVSYGISEVISEGSAYNYAVTYIGDKEKYTREDINNLIQLIKNDKNIETSNKKLVK